MGGLVTEMVWTLIVGIAAYTALYALLLIQRVLYKNSQNELNILKSSITGG